MSLQQNYQEAAQEATAQYYSNIISKHSHRPTIMISTINKVINPPICSNVEAFSSICGMRDSFFDYFSENIRSLLTPSPSDTLICSAPVIVGTLNYFGKVSLHELEEMVMHPNTKYAHITSWTALALVSTLSLIPG